MVCKNCTLSQFILGFKNRNFYPLFFCEDPFWICLFFTTSIPCKVCQNCSCLWNLDTVMVQIYVVVISLLFAKVQQSQQKNLEKNKRWVYAALIHETNCIMLYDLRRLFDTEICCLWYDSCSRCFKQNNCKKLKILASHCTTLLNMPLSCPFARPINAICLEYRANSGQTHSLLTIYWCGLN